MRIQLFSWLSLIPFCLILLGIHIVSVSGQCLDDQQSILIQLNNTIKFDSSLSTKIVSWNQGTDCCSWKGVNCSTDGHVIGLDLSNESISGGIENSSALFTLQFLHSLSLANNNFNLTQIPPGIGNLTNLAHLNLSSAGFSGQIPVELSNMIRLVTLDLSALTFPGGSSLKLENPNLAMLLQNLKELTELYLDGVNISAQGYDWCQAISSSLPKLKVLSLSNCLLSGPIDASFAKLQSLSVIRLSQNNLSSHVPEFFANFTNLTVLKLSSCHLYGQFPGMILQVPTLETLDLSNNVLLHGFLPKFPQNGSLQTLVLSITNFSQGLPDSIGNLRMLSRLELASSNFSGQIPDSMASLTQLVYLDLSSNQFAGPIPSFQKSKNLTYLDLSHNGLSGPIPNTYFEGLVNLAHFDLAFNAFNGSIPPSLFALSSLQNIRLSNNNFHGLLANFSNASSSLLDTLDLSSNRLEGPIPKSFFDLRRLKILSLSNNHLNGTTELEAFSGLDNLTTLDLSYNNLSIETRGENSSLSAVPQFSTLKMASCKLQHFPNLKNLSRVISLDLSNNQIDGEIPSWIWKVGSGNLAYLNLSRNLLVNFQQPYEIPPGLSVLDLHSNRLHGEIPILPQAATYLDYSANQFNSSLPDHFGYNLTLTYFFSISSNSITGIIPSSICTATYLKVLDLSNNHLSGKIPSCLVQLTGSLGVLNLGKNSFSGNIPGTFPRDCGLETLDLHGNRLGGSVPNSLASCTMLEVLNLGNNRINDTFPCFLKNNTYLRVLVLRSNMLRGGIGCKGTTSIWPKLQIIDIASNYFTGHVPQGCFLNWGNMMTDEDDAQSKLRHLRFQVLQLNQFYYLDTVTVTNKGFEMELVKILTVFTSIDISNNRFSGEIPGSIGELKALYVLNVSHNAFTGSIPRYIGNLRQLGSLDLSLNNLSGRIPIELANLTFLSFLNLSYNQLDGPIPASSQLQTFTETSFEGNKGLCGPQLYRTCNRPEVEPTSALDTEEPASMHAFNWHSIFTGLGFGVGAAIVLGPLMFWKQGRDWWHDHTDKLVFVILSPLGYTDWDDVRYETEENIQEEPHDSVEDSEEEDGLKGKSFQGKYCVFCTKLDIQRKQAIHNFKCTCHNSIPMFSSSSSSSSSYSDSPFSKS